MSIDAATFYGLVDQLNAKWKELVKAMPIRGEFAPPGCKLSLMRSRSGEIQFGFNGTAITECRAREKIEAVSHLEAFMELYVAESHRLAEDAWAACCKIDAHIAELKQKAPSPG